MMPDTNKGNGAMHLEKKVLILELNSTRPWLSEIVPTVVINFLIFAFMITDTPNDYDLLNQSSLVSVTKVQTFVRTIKTVQKYRNHPTELIVLYSYDSLTDSYS